jgi:flavin-dependent dehydrogenase
MKEYDIVIVGAGPAGSTLARLLGNRYRILLLDKRTFDGTGRRKSCGGLVAPDAQKMLAAFGLGIPLPVLVSPQIFSVRTLDLEAGIGQDYQRQYVNVDREALDRWLLSLVPHRDFQGSAYYRGHQTDGRKLRVTWSAGDRTESVRTRLLVGADGAGSRVRSQLSENKQTDRSVSLNRNYISIQHWYEGTGDTRAYGAFFDNRLTDFYGWTIPKGNALIVGAALKPGSDAAAQFCKLKEGLRENGYPLDDSRIIRREGALIFRPRTPRDLVTGRGQTALIGEAAGFISPSSAEGLSYAFRSALHLAEALDKGFDGWAGRYRAGCRELFADILWKQFKGLGMSTPLLRRAALRSGIGSLKLPAGRDWSISTEPVRIGL